MSSLTHSEAEKLTYIYFIKASKSFPLCMRLRTTAACIPKIFLIYHIGMEVGIEGSLVICCAIALALIYDTTMVVPRNKKKQFEIVRSLRTICM